MASKLLNVLQDIERGRKKCVIALQNHNSNIQNDASLDEIAAVVNTLDLQNNHIVPINNFSEYTPETDPHIWHYPTFWPDVEAILKTRTTHMNGTINIYVQNILLLDATDNTIIFNPNITTGSTTRDEHTFYIGPVSNSQRKSIELSDGTVYDFDTTNNVAITHTWDSSKDIVIDGHSFRWVIMYGQVGGTNNAGYLDYIKIPALAFVETDQGFGRYGNSHFMCVPKTLKYFVVTDYNPSAQSSTGYWHYGINDSGFIGTNYPELRNQTYIEYIDLKSPRLAENSFQYSSNHVMLNTFKTKVHMSAASALNFTESLRYVEMPYYIGSLSYLNSNMWQVSTRSVRYLYIDPEQQRTKEILGIPCLSDLLDSNLVENITTINIASNSNNAHCIIHSFDNEKVLNFEKLTNIINRDYNLFGYTYIHTLLMPELTGKLPKLNGLTCFAAYLPKITNIENVDYLPQSALYVDLSGVTTVTSTYLCNNNQCGAGLSNSVLELDLSSLKAVPTADWFAGCRMLKFLHLSEDFASDLNLSSCRSLTPEAIVEIINDLKDITNTEESYTLTLSAHQKTRVADAIAIATNKGWTVN